MKAMAQPLPKRLRRLWPYYLIVLATVLRLLPDVSRTLFIATISLLVWLDIFFMRSRASVLLLHPRARILRIGFFCLFVFWMLVPLSYYSDDWIRHVYDGLQLSRSQPVYRIPPQELGHPPGFDLFPNHPFRQTIYLPATQLQAWLAGWAFYGLQNRIPAVLLFSSLYAGLTAWLLFGAWRLMRRKQRALLLSFMGTGCFLVFSASLHADVQGMFAGLALLAGSRAGGALAVLLPLLKPEGIFLSLQGLLQRQNGLAAFAVTAGLTALIMGLFSRWVLWPEIEDLGGFLDQTRFFSQWWTAYHPVIYTLQGFGYSVIEAQSLYRTGLLIVLPPLLFAFWRRGGRGWRVGAIGLLLYFCWRITLHPWYFLWFVPFLILRGAHRLLAWFPLLLLFYAVIPDYRAGNSWQEGPFFVLFMLHAILLVFIDRSRRIGLIQS